MTAIIDAHHHIWRRADLPWLEGPMQPRIFGPYEPIRRDYPISEYLADIAGCDIVRIRLRAGQLGRRRRSPTRSPTYSTPPMRPAIRKRSSAMPTFSRADVRPQLDRLSKYPGMRGLRMQLHWHENPQYRFAARPRPGARPDAAEERRAACRLWLVASISRCSPAR